MASPQYVLCHEPPVQDLSWRQAGLEGHHARLFARRQDRRGRLERRRQIDAAPHHGGRRDRVSRRGLGADGVTRRLSAAGAAARSEQGRHRQRDGRRGGEEGEARPLQRARHRTIPTRPPTRWRSSRTRSTPRTCGTSMRRSSRPWTRSAARPATPTVDTLSGGESGAWRSAACCWPSPISFCSTSRPTISTPKRGLARASFARLSRHRGHGHPRPLLPRQHHRMDARARSRRRHSLSRQLFLLARAEAQAARGRRQAGRGARAHACPRARLDQGEPQGASGEIKGAHQSL